MKYNITKKGIIVCVLLNLLSVVCCLLLVLSIFSTIVSSNNTFTSNTEDTQNIVLGLEEVSADHVDVLDNMQGIVESYEVELSETTLEDEVVMYSRYSDMPVYYIDDFSPDFIDGLLKEYYPMCYVELQELYYYTPSSLWCILEESEEVMYLCEVSGYNVTDDGDVTYDNLSKLFRLEYNVSSNTVIAFEEGGV